MLLTYYGDDFSGSTDVMEALTLGGVPAVLFLAPPAPRDLQRFPNCKAAGVAGLSRGESPEWMSRNLPPVFQALRQLGAPLCHYKVCSTFDSSPSRGSIGRAIELGRDVFETPVVPLVVGAPVLRRYVVFANLFATVDGVSYRIDRHPTMSRHPVTPMDEGDLRLHLARQTALPISHVDILALARGEAGERFQAAEPGVVLFDTLDEASLREAGRAIWEARDASRPMFVAGSSGVEYALLAYWRETGEVPPQTAKCEARPEDRMLVVSGSCSPRTGEQVKWAMANGFRGIRVEPGALLASDQETGRVSAAALAALQNGESPLLYTAAGPADIVATDEREIGLRLGSITRKVAAASGVRRILVAGGDTSGRVGHALEIQALTMVRPFAPGSPLCRIWSPDATMDGVEILFKGGQVGGVTLFGEVRNGKPGI